MGRGAAITGFRRHTSAQPWRIADRDSFCRGRWCGVLLEPMADQVASLGGGTPRWLGLVSVQVTSGHLFATHPSGGLIWSGGPTGPEGSIYVIPTMAVIARGVWIAWNQRQARKEPAATLATRS